MFLRRGSTLTVIVNNRLRSLNSGMRDVSYALRLHLRNLLLIEQVGGWHGSEWSHWIGHSSLTLAAGSLSGDNRMDIEFLQESRSNGWFDFCPVS